MAANISFDMSASLNLLERYWRRLRRLRAQLCKTLDRLNSSQQVWRLHHPHVHGAIPIPVENVADGIDQHDCRMVFQQGSIGGRQGTAQPGDMEGCIVRMDALLLDRRSGKKVPQLHLNMIDRSIEINDPAVVWFDRVTDKEDAMALPIHEEMQRHLIDIEMVSALQAPDLVQRDVILERNRHFDAAAGIARNDAVERPLSCEDIVTDVIMRLKGDIVVELQVKWLEPDDLDLNAADISALFDPSLIGDAGCALTRRACINAP